MTWKIKQRKHDDGNFRYVRHFAILPINAGQEWKWLEVCYIRQQRWYSYDGDEYWVNDKFVDKSLYEGYRHSDKLENTEL